MTVMSMAALSGLAAAHDLRRVMQGKLALPGDAAYSRGRRLFNGAVDRHPAVIAICETMEDARAALRAGRAHNLPLSVRGGGHDWAGRALRQDGLVIDLSAMRRVSVDAGARLAVVEGGATAADVIAAAEPHGLVAVTGAVGSVGMAGLTLGGGYGPLNARHGLALDNLVSAEVVLGDGKTVIADTMKNAELFWALRGGGGNFGVVTSLSIRLHPLDEILAGLILFPAHEAAAVLAGYGEMLAEAPDELSILAGIVSGPDGTPAVFLAPSWSGASSAGEAVMVALQRLGHPIMAMIQPMAYGRMLGLFDAQAVGGRHYEMETRWLPELSAEAIAVLVEGGDARTSPYSAIVLHHFHGAAARVPLDATALGPRRRHFMVEIIACWDAGEARLAARHRRWAENLSAALAPSALPGGYPNLLGPEQRDRAALGYGYKIVRLQRAKQRFDPDNVFNSATPLPP
jgi:FAD/FMN-containing dehydrogenase